MKIMNKMQYNKNYYSYTHTHTYILLTNEKFAGIIVLNTKGLFRE